VLDRFLAKSPRVLRSSTPAVYLAWPCDFLTLSGLATRMSQSGAMKCCEDHGNPKPSMPCPLPAPHRPLRAIAISSGRSSDPSPRLRFHYVYPPRGALLFIVFLFVVETPSGISIADLSRVLTTEISAQIERAREFRFVRGNDNDNGRVSVQLARAVAGEGRLAERPLAVFFRQEPSAVVPPARWSTDHAILRTYARR
jgi:hypothetical protein